MALTKYKELVIKHWIPALVTGVFGIVIGLSVSFFESEISDNRFFLEKQTTTADRVAIEFSTYVQNWRKIVKLKEYVNNKNQKPTEHEIAQLKKFVERRDLARDKLFYALDALHLYFEKETSSLASSFKQWDELQSTKTSLELPKLSEWQKRERTMLLSMRKELMK